MGTPSGERDQQLNCLAHWLLDHWKTKDERQESLARIEKRHGKAFADDLRKRVMMIWHERAGRVDAVNAR